MNDKDVLQDETREDGTHLIATYREVKHQDLESGEEEISRIVVLRVEIPYKDDLNYMRSEPISLAMWEDEPMRVIWWDEQVEKCKAGFEMWKERRGE